MKARQSGMTLIGFIFVLFIAGFFALMAMKLFPPYSTYFSITKAMKQMAAEGVDGKNADEVRRDFMYKLSFQYADTALKPQDIQFVRHDEGTDLQVKYDVRVPFVYNIDFLLHFQKTVVLNGTLN